MNHNNKGTMKEPTFSNIGGRVTKKNRGAMWYKNHIYNILKECNLVIIKPSRRNAISGEPEHTLIFEENSIEYFFRNSFIS